MLPEAMFLEPTVAEFPPPWQHCCHRTAEEMPMLVNLYSREWLQTYSREVEMHIYKEGDQITAQSPECKWGHEGEDVSSDFPRRLPCPPSAWHPGPRLYPWLTRSMEVRTPTRNLRKSVPSKSSRNRFINF